jgi:DNA polymerase-3 subunit delta
MDIANEVDKILIAFPDSKTISFDEIRNFIGFTRNNTPFDLTNFVAARNSKKAFSILHNLLKTPYQEVIIIAILRDLFIKILKLIELKAENSSDEKIATSIGVHRFYLNDYMIALSKYSVNEVENALIILCNTDKAIKSSNASNKLIMHEMLLNIVG